jgi:hypothetical protein
VGLSAARRSGPDRVPNSLVANGRPGSHALDRSVQVLQGKASNCLPGPDPRGYPFRVLGEEFGQAADLFRGSAPAPIPDARVLLANRHSSGRLMQKDETRGPIASKLTTSELGHSAGTW